MRYASFVIRIWLPVYRIDSNPMGSRGSIEHIQSGTVVQIADLEQIHPALLELLKSIQQTKEGKAPAKKSA